MSGGVRVQSVAGRWRKGCAANQVRQHYRKVFAVAAETINIERQRSLSTARYLCRMRCQHRIAAPRGPDDRASTVLKFIIPIATTSRAV